MEVIELHKRRFLSKEIYICPMGSQNPWMYGLPKFQKVGIPLSPILSMVGSTQHGLDTWLTEFLDLILVFYSEYCVPDLFQFAGYMHKLKPNPDTKHFV